ncbi:polysaccharide deacetylase family protein [Ruminococcus sp.]|uniref:polysaccharide deacetylase family protein n=1 Tax=Ruminococcus sp. TaxID=41978 RepID=UPI00258FDD36|nr:polysaccharide deacetylase family protein [Ruminococcus sp.]MCR5021724.1 polysaccharide deacetylase family protein [Ruminococcus sp.]
MIKAVLTIDDIASDNTRAIVDYLCEKDIHPVMFAWGEKVEEFWDNAVYALQNGIIVGNHSFSHLEFSKLTFEQGVAEIEKCEEILDKLYKAAGVERKFRPFRFPYGDKGGANKDAFQKYLADKCFDKLDDRDISYPWWKEMGLDKDIDTLWTFDFAEYNIRRGNDFTIDDVWKRVNDPAPGSGATILKDGGRHIILLHAHDETEELVPGYYKLFIDKLLENGVEFVEPNFIHI